MARDGFDREIDYLRISITDRCNLGCIYCMPGQRPDCTPETRALSAEEILRIVRLAVAGFGVRKVRLTGGEPLLRADILEILRGIKATGVADLSLTTNGLELGRMAQSLKDAGLGRLNVSLDTMDHLRFKEIAGGGELLSVIEGIREAEAVGLDPIKLNMVPMRGINDDEVPAFARMTLHKPVHIRFIEFMPSGRENLWSQDRSIKSEELLARIEAEVGPLAQMEFKGKGPSRNYRLAGAQGIIGFISPLSHSFCYSCNRLRITAAGKIKPCLFSNTEIDLISPMREGASDEEVARLIGLAVATKPEGNYLKDPSGRRIKSMSSIGG